MATWWITEALPISVVSLVPIALFPALGIMDSSEVTLQYAHHIVFLFMSGFLIAMAMQKWELHRGIALHIINFIGTGPKKIILGFMFASAFLSMWVSNTATSMMMVTIALAILSYVGNVNEEDNTNWEESKFGKTLLLGIAYACSIGGIGTLIGTPPTPCLPDLWKVNSKRP